MGLFKLGENQKKDIVKQILITKTGRIFDLEFEVEDGRINDAEYLVNTEARLLRKKTPAYVHIEGIADPLNFSDILKTKNIKDIKLGSKSLKAILKTKLFKDLFSPEDKSMIKSVVEILQIVNTVLLLLLVLKDSGVLSGILRK